MRKQEATRKHVQSRHPRWLLPLGLLTVAVFFSFLGVNCLWHHLRDGQPRPFRAPAGLLLVAMGVTQLHVARAVWYRRRENADAWRRLFNPLLWQWLLVGLVFSYVLGMALDSGPYVRYWFRASLGFWTTLALLPLAVDTAAIARLARLNELGSVRLFRRLAVVGALALVGVEAALRGYCWLSGDSIPVIYLARGLKLPPGAHVRGQTVNLAGYWDDEFETVNRAGRLRIAALGDDAALTGTAETNCLSRIEQLMPGVEVFNFALPSAGPREYAAQFTHEVARYRPDLVLAMLSVGDDVTTRLPLPDTYDWRSLHSYQLGVRSLGPHVVGNAAETCFERPSNDYEAYLQVAAARMAVCRTPMDEAMHRRWEETHIWLDRIADRCRRREIPFALVLVPDDYQLDAALCQTLRRRCGCRQEQLDLELPQRRLKLYAERRQLPVLDLLPHFRASHEAAYGRNSHLWNDHGNAVAADAIAGWLRTRYGTMLASTVAVQ